MQKQRAVAPSDSGEAWDLIECGMELDDYYTGDNRLYCSGTQVLTSSGQVINSCGAFENFTSDD